MRVFSGSAIHSKLQDIAANIDEALLRTLPTAKSQVSLSAAKQQLQHLLAATADTDAQDK